MAGGDDLDSPPALRNGQQRRGDETQQTRGTASAASSGTGISYRDTWMGVAAHDAASGPTSPRWASADSGRPAPSHAVRERHESRVLFPTSAVCQRCTSAALPSGWGFDAQQAVQYQDHCRQRMQATYRSRRLMAAGGGVATSLAAQTNKRGSAPWTPSRRLTARSGQDRREPLPAAGAVRCGPVWAGSSAPRQPFFSTTTHQRAGAGYQLRLQASHPSGSTRLRNGAAPVDCQDVAIGPEFATGPARVCRG